MHNLLFIIHYFFHSLRTSLLAAHIFLKMYFGQILLDGLFGHQKYVFGQERTPLAKDYLVSKASEIEKAEQLWH